MARPPKSTAAEADALGRNEPPLALDDAALASLRMEAVKLCYRHDFDADTIVRKAAALTAFVTGGRSQI